MQSIVVFHTLVTFNYYIRSYGTNCMAQFSIGLPRSLGTLALFILSLLSRWKQGT